MDGRKANKLGKNQLKHLKATNEFREAIGMPPLKVKTRHCLKCNKQFETIENRLCWECNHGNDNVWLKAIIVHPNGE
jgi:predicted amidophosphoribosyltransferase